MGGICLIGECMKNLSELIAKHEEIYGDQSGRIPAPFEIITLTGWAPAPNQQKPAKRASAQILLKDDLKKL